MGMKEVAKTEAKKAVKAHEKSMHAKGYAKGGVTSLQRKQLGRGLAKVANQKKSSFTYKGQKTNA
ncbi:MAG: hypothetical protein RL156_1702 [Bacteroidota bacterium]|jgi:hypothetical protein